MRIGLLSAGDRRIDWHRLVNVRESLTKRWILGSCRFDSLSIVRELIYINAADYCDLKYVAEIYSNKKKGERAHKVLRKDFV